MQQQYFGFHAPHSAPNQPDPPSELRQTGSLYDKHIQQPPHSKPALNSDLAQPSSLPTTPTTKSLPRPKSEKNVLSPSIPKYLQQGSGTLRKISSRIDPSQIPRPGKYHKETVFHTRSSSARKNPPSVNSIYVGVDNGNSLPQHLRCTLVAPPSTRDLYKRTELPLCLLATPLARLGTGEEEIATVEMSSPPRCHKCAAYVNPSVQFLDEGRKWVCNLCSNQNTVPDWYYSPLDAAGLRFDRIKRPELCKGSVEFLVGSDYITVSPSKESRTVIFAVDVSSEAMRRGITAAAIRAVTTAVQQLSQHCQRLNTTRSSESLLPAPPQLYQPQANSFTAIEPPSELDYSIGLVGFSSHLHFYDVDLQAHETVKVLSAEADDPFPPLPNHKWLFSLNRQFAQLDHLLSGRWLQILEKELEYLPAVPSFQPITSPAAVIAALQSAQPGFGSAKVYLFTSNHSSTGLGQHSSRQRDYLYGYAEEFLMYATPPITSLSSTATPLTAKYLTTPVASSSSHTSLPWKDVLAQTFEQYKQLGNDCLEKNISISVFFFSPPPSPVQRPGETSHPSSDVTFLGEVVKTTGGKLFMLQDPPLNQGNEDVRSPPIRSPMVLPSPSPLPAPLQLPHLPAFPAFLPSSADVLERQLVYDLVEEWMGSDVVMKLRSSAAVTLHQVISAGQYDSLEEVVRLADIGNTSTVLFDCKVVRDLPDEEKIHFQLATLFTNRQQQRVLRVHNLTLITSNKGNVIFRNCDVEAIAVAVAKMASVRAVSFPLGDEKEGARNFIQTKTIDMLLHYRKLCSSASSPKAQLILPESLKTLPMYCLGMTKHPFLVDNLPVVSARQTHSLSHTSAASPTSPPTSSNILVTVNERFYHLLRLTSSPLRDVLNSVYPRVYSLFAVLESDSFSNYNNTLTGSFDDIAQIPSTDSIDSLNDGADGGSSKLRGLDTHNLSSPNLHSLHINASLSASSSMPPTPSAAMSGGGGISVLTDKLYLDKLKVSQSLNPSSENFESDQIYVIDDRRTLWLYIGRSVPQDLLEELFVMTSPYERSERVRVNVRSRLGRRAEDFLLLLASDGPYQSEIKAIWADSQLTMPSIHRFTSRLIEDANNGMMSYVDYLCNLHARMQGKL